MTDPDTKEKNCPRCGGSTGYEHTMRETHHMSARWGDVSESGSGGHDVVFGRVTCSDCGAVFNFKSLEKKGLLGPAYDRGAL
jgi:ribosomal protein S27AE